MCGCRLLLLLLARCLRVRACAQDLCELDTLCGWEELACLNTSTPLTEKHAEP